MTVTIRQVGPCFAGEVSGIDMRKPLSPGEVAAIHAGDAVMVKGSAGSKMAPIVKALVRHSSRQAVPERVQG